MTQLIRSKRGNRPHLIDSHSLHDRRPVGWRRLGSMPFAVVGDAMQCLRARNLSGNSDIGGSSSACSADVIPYGQVLTVAKAQDYDANLAKEFAETVAQADRVYTATFSDETEADVIAAYRESNATDMPRGIRVASR